jgi:homogentisate 1,2-dioxygenase
MNVTLRPVNPSPSVTAARGYMTGFGNDFETEALPGALPVGRNSPQRCPYGLYAEQISGSPFTAPRATNERSWLYRIRPTVKHWGRFVKANARFWRTAPCAEFEMPIAPLRWSPIPLPGERLSFTEGMHTITTGGDAGSHAGMAAHVYLAMRSMRGPIGANCLANPRDFQTPHAAYEDRDGACTMTVKWGGSLWTTQLMHSPLDVVAWHGNYAPYKYDLRRFSPVGPVLFDHADPSIFTVLTSPSETPGTANIDFVLFSDRWLVAENTFRPPWYHMNVMSEFMGLVYGVYDAKTGGGFAPGGMSLHNSMLPHGPDMNAFERASNADLAPHKLEGTMAFMFESRFPQRVTAYAGGLAELQQDYMDCWGDLKKHFDPTNP